ncbi:DUF5677 domain-containing protein [Caulobacter sp. SSI4214]|uniref:DUF5677 domain-containing protein n=1 Tax=Caulobacter sp. SSI4214 TaxID=2575739 RepID=UPI001439BC66|nr:DUF5677 domain-containing protein [Caulobacter sp. SSI4214]
MSILEQGFLSPDIGRFIREHRHTNAEAFELAEGLNKTAQKLMAAARVKIESKSYSEKNLAQLLFVRTLSNFQGAILMAERGAVVEARTLARTCLETVFALGAAVKMDQTFVHKMIANDMGSRRTKAYWLLERSNQDEFLAPESQAELRGFLDKLQSENTPTGGFPAEDMARRGGLHDLYIFFRQLSSDAAHPMLDALNRYVDDRQGGVGADIMWGPDCSSAEIGPTIELACCFLLAGTVAFKEIANATDFDDMLEAHWLAYKKLIGDPEA